MRIALEIDDKLFQSAAQLLGTDDHSTVINAALQVLVERESARRLVNLGGSDPDMSVIPRRRTPKGPPST
ncbi:MAG: type II toxin-antitoxin system VapB family antitoxin [Candidatus Hydrogenedentes bacterium]|nr:type II toxin-antitoxin system VapB family antitoxin [Candidatus Hydrogenedentota bacterium]